VSRPGPAQHIDPCVVASSGFVQMMNVDADFGLTASEYPSVILTGRVTEKPDLPPDIQSRLVVSWEIRLAPVLA
jgi:hypothetical protein